MNAAWTGEEDTHGPDVAEGAITLPRMKGGRLSGKEPIAYTHIPSDTVALSTG